MANLNFVLMGNSPSGLTQIYQVQSVHTGVVLGDVKWYAPWARYAFFPGPALFDSLCLREIAHFIDGEMDTRRRKHRGELCQ